MRGLFKRKASKAWQGRFRIPEHLWQQRDILRNLGVADVGNSQEFARSLQTDQKDKAEVIYRAMLTQWDSQMAAWDLVLQNGPMILSSRQALAIALVGAAARFKEYQDNPVAAPPPPTVASTPVGLAQTENIILACLAPEERRAALEELRCLGLGLQSDDPMEQEKWQNALVNGEGWLWVFPVLRVKLLLSADAKAGANSDAAMEAASVKAIDTNSRHRLNMATMATESKYRDSLAWSLTNLGDPPLVEEAKLASIFASPKASVKHALSLFDLLDHKATVHNIKSKTISDDRSYLNKFTTFLGHSDVDRITKEDVRNWRDQLIKDGNLSTKTINDKYLSAVRAVLSHGVKEFHLTSNVASNIRDNRESGLSSGPNGYSDEQAVTILKATFDGSAKNLSTPHKRALFWVPWVLAYTGLRVSEVTQFQGRNLKFDSGTPFLLITPEDGSTKSGRAWTAAIHQHLIDIGLIEMIQRFGPGPLFYDPYPHGTDLQKLGEKHRAKESGVRVSNWITKDLKIVAPLNRANHAWRHSFTTRGRAAEIKEVARDYMLGSAKSDAREGYGHWPPQVLSNEINKLPRFAVTDTGWRPE